MIPATWPRERDSCDAESFSLLLCLRMFSLRTLDGDVFLVFFCFMCMTKSFEFFYVIVRTTVVSLQERLILEGTPAALWVGSKNWGM